MLQFQPAGHINDSLALEFWDDSTYKGKPMQPYRVDFETLPWESPATGVRFKAWRHNDQQIRIVEFGSDFVEPDWCTRTHAGYVLEGECVIDFPDQSVTYSQGDGVWLPTGESSRHKLRVPSGRATLILFEPVQVTRVDPAASLKAE